MVWSGRAEGRAGGVRRVSPAMPTPAGLAFLADFFRGAAGNNARIPLDMLRVPGRSQACVTANVLGYCLSDLQQKGCCRSDTTVRGAVPLLGRNITNSFTLKTERLKQQIKSGDNRLWPDLG